MGLKIFRGSEDWSALYVDGVLERIGDSYLIDEKVFELLKVDEEHSDDFLLGGNDRDTAAKNLEEIETYRDRKSEESLRKQEIENKIRELQEEARKIEENL